MPNTEVACGAVPTVFELYPSYMVPAAKRPRKDPAYRDPPAPRNSSKRKAESLLPVHEDFGAREEVTEQRQSASTQTNSNNAHRSSYYLVIMKRFRAQVACQRSKCAGLLTKLAVDKENMNDYNDDKHYIAVKKIVADSQKGEKKAVFLRHQIEVYGSKRPCYSEEVVRECLIWRFLSPKGYDHGRKSDLLTLPAKCTLQRYVGPSPTSSGMSPAMKERLIFEASMLSSKQHMASLIVDEAAIKPNVCMTERPTQFLVSKTNPATVRQAARQRLLQIEYCALFCMVWRIHTGYHVPTTLRNS
ncbi:hypothetical protein HPB49_005754 [Dermacentor silvarum]|uniref:Uncharacterized protein n=1 Tax=Dermacentor silvarum TaxID=543639 RepID=A0ACB8C7F2_DERSI|nr:hypothetical protein HPB49_005754 [Dermacentor silvarum]